MQTLESLLFAIHQSWSTFSRLRLTKKIVLFLVHECTVILPCSVPGAILCGLSINLMGKYAYLQEKQNCMTA